MCGLYTNVLGMPAGQCVQRGGASRKIAGGAWNLSVVRLWSHCNLSCFSHETICLLVAHMAQLSPKRPRSTTPTIPQGICRCPCKSEGNQENNSGDRPASADFVLCFYAWLISANCRSSFGISHSDFGCSLTLTLSP